VAKQKAEVDGLKEELRLEDEKAAERLAKYLNAQHLFEDQELEHEKKETEAIVAAIEEAKAELKELKQLLKEGERGVKRRILEIKENLQRCREEETKIASRKAERKRIRDAAVKQHKEEEQLKRLRDLKDYIRERRSVVVKEIMDRKREEEEEAARQLAEKRRIEREQQQANMADEAVAELGLLRTEKRRKRVVTNVMRMLRGDPAQNAEEATMKLAVQNHMRVKTGRPAAIRSIKFTVGLEETNEFADHNAKMKAEGLPHFIRMEKGIGMNAPITLWYEQTIDQDEFITDIVLSHSSPDHPLYVDMSGSGFTPVVHPLMQGADNLDPCIIMWIERNKFVLEGIKDINVSFSSTDEAALTNEGYVKLKDGEMAPYGFGEMYMWVRKESRNALPAVESSEVVARELREVRKLAKKRPDDPAIADMVKRLEVKLGKAQAAEDEARKNVDNPLKYAMEIFAFSRDDIEQMMVYFMNMDKERVGHVSTEDFFDFIHEPPSRLGEQIFDTLDALDEDQRLDFGEFCRVVGTFAFFGPEEVLRFTYQLCDAEDRGQLFHEEFMKLLSILHPTDVNGRVQRALREFDVNEGSVFTFDEFKDLNARFPNLLYPAFRLQDAVRRAFLGVRYWEKKLRKYSRIRDNIRTAKVNSDILERKRKARAARMVRREKEIKYRKGAARNAPNKAVAAYHTARYMGANARKRWNDMLLA